MVSRLTEEKRTSSEESRYESARRNSLHSQFDLKEINFTQNSEQSCFKVNLSMAFSCNQILDLFCETAVKCRYNIVEREQAQATAVSKPQNVFTDFVFKCLPIRKNSDSSTTIMQILVGFNERKCQKTVLVKGLSGEIKMMRSFVKIFSKKLGKLHLSRKLNINQMDPLRQSQTEEEEETVQINNESSSYYQFHKILSQESYSLGKTMSQFIDNFNKQYKSVEEAAQVIPQPMEAIKSHIEQTIRTLFSDFNFGKLQAERMMHHCRPAVEKFVFGKLNIKLENIYKYKYREEDERFATKCLTACKLDLMNFLEFKQKFKLEGVSQPYFHAIAEIQKIKQQQNPKDQIQCIVATSAAIKTDVIDYWKGQEEIEALDDLLPVLIFVLANSNIPNLPSQLRYLTDFIRGHSKYENEQMQITNISAASTYIINTNFV